MPGAPLETSRSISQEDANQAQEALKVLKLEKLILGNALTTIYESHSKDLINQAERDRLLEKYKVDLNGLEKSIEEKQHVVDLFELEAQREELVKGFRTRLAEIDAQVKTLKSGGTIHLTRARKTDQDEAEKKSSSTKNEEKKSQSSKEQAAKEKKPAEPEEQQISDAEKRVEQIREEILKAMDRLEQIEAEG